MCTGTEMGHPGSEVLLFNSGSSPMACPHCTTPHSCSHRDPRRGSHCAGAGEKLTLDKLEARLVGIARLGGLAISEGD